MWRPLADSVYAQPLVVFARMNDSRHGSGSDGAQPFGEPAPAPPAPLANLSALLAPLPDHVQLVTLQELRPGRLLLRLAHQLAIGEDAVLAQVGMALATMTKLTRDIL